MNAERQTAQQKPRLIEQSTRRMSILLWIANITAFAMRLRVDNVEGWEAAGLTFFFFWAVIQHDSIQTHPPFTGAHDLQQQEVTFVQRRPNEKSEETTTQITAAPKATRV